MTLSYPKIDPGILLALKSVSLLLGKHPANYSAFVNLGRFLLNSYSDKTTAAALGDGFLLLAD